LEEFSTVEVAVCRPCTFSAVQQNGLLGPESF